MGEQSVLLKCDPSILSGNGIYFSHDWGFSESLDPGYANSADIVFVFCFCFFVF